MICGRAPIDDVQDRRLRLPQQPQRERVDGVKDLVIRCLREPQTGCQKGEGRKKTTVQVIELAASGSHPKLYLDSVKAEEYEV